MKNFRKKLKGKSDKNTLFQKAASAAALAVLLVFTLASCSDTFKVRFEETGFYNAETGIRYIHCGRAVYALRVGKLYARDGKGGEYSEIPFEDPQKFLCDNDTDLPSVYRAEDEPEIGVGNFNPVAAFLYLEGETTLWADQFVAEAKYTGRDDVSDDSVYTYAIRDAMTGEEPVLQTSPAQNEMANDYTVHIRLLSQDYPGLYYEVVFWRDLDGINYLYDMGTGYSYLCPYKVTYRLWADAS